MDIKEIKEKLRLSVCAPVDFEETPFDPFDGKDELIIVRTTYDVIKYCDFLFDLYKNCFISFFIEKRYKNGLYVTENTKEIKVLDVKRNNGMYTFYSERHTVNIHILNDNVKYRSSCNILDEYLRYKLYKTADNGSYKETITIMLRK